jgi:tetrahydromethanopterin S-methyltransferase subunit F
MATPTPAPREQLFQMELAQIHRNARMRAGVVWAFIFISLGRGLYEYLSRQGAEGLAEGILYATIPAIILALMGFPLVRLFARKAEEKLRGRFAHEPRRDPRR